MSAPSPERVAVELVAPLEGRTGQQRDDRLRWLYRHLPAKCEMVGCAWCIEVKR